VTGGDGGIGQAIADGFDGTEDGIIPFSSKGFHGGISHFDDFLAVMDLEAGIRFFVTKFFEFLADPVFLAKKE
jgi:hypothetical protein